MNQRFPERRADLREVASAWLACALVAALGLGLVSERHRADPTPFAAAPSAPPIARLASPTPSGSGTASAGRMQRPHRSRSPA